MRSPTRLQNLLLAQAAAIVCLARITLGDPPSSILPGRPDAQTPTAQQSQNLGAPFEDPVAGVAFQPPAGMKQIRGTPGDVIVRYVDDDRHWVLAVSKMSFQRPVRISNPAATQPMPTAEKTSQGILELTAAQMKIDAPGAEILRQDVITIGGMDVGMLAARYSIAPQTNLTQQAVFRVDDENFYLFNLTVPAPRDVKTEDLSTDPNVQSAVDTFTQVLDTVRLLEQTAVREEQEQRLMLTRTLFVNWTPDRIKAALVKEQWLRLLRSGKDVGYSYVVEDVGRDLPRPGHKESQFTGGQEGALIGIRSRTVPQDGVRVDAESWMWVSFDRKHEKWSNSAYINKGPDAAGKPQIDHVGDVGSSDVEEETVYDKSLVGHPEQIGPGKDDVDKSQPPFRRREVYTLNVEQIGKNQSGEPVIRKLPVFYIPQAMAHLLPRLVPIHEPQKLMFASYVPEKREVMARYVDVGGEEQVSLGGTSFQAIPIHDRLGLEGSVTTHYVDSQGKYMGTENKDSNIQILPSDAATLERLWKNVDLTKPGAVPDEGPR